MPPERRCRTCRKTRPARFFDGANAKRCQPCWRRLAAKAACRACGGPAPFGVNARPRLYCDDAACQERKRADLREAAKRARLANPKTHHVCPVCAKRKPWTTENFPVKSRNADGTPAALEAYCRSCKATDQRLRYQADPERRRRAVERAAARRERIMARAAVDPEFDAERRRRYREWEREYRARGRRNAGQATPVEQHDKEGGARLPASPLIAIVTREIRKLEMCGYEAPIDVVASRVGVEVRTIGRWLTGEIREINLNVADRALIGLGLLWWEVWEPGAYPDIAAMWEGERAA